MKMLSLNTVKRQNKTIFASPETLQYIGYSSFISFQDAELPNYLSKLPIYIKK